MEALFGKTLDELTALAVEIGLPKFTGKQLAEWLYQKDIRSIDEMTNPSMEPKNICFQRPKVNSLKPR